MASPEGTKREGARLVRASRFPTTAEMPRLSYVGFKVLPFMASKAKYAKRKVRMRAAHTANIARGTEKQTSISLLLRTSEVGTDFTR